MKGTIIKLIIEDIKNQRLVLELNELDIDPSDITSGISVCVFELMNVSIEIENENIHDKYMDIIKEGVQNDETNENIAILAFDYINQFN